MLARLRLTIWRGIAGLVRWRQTNVRCGGVLPRNSIRAFWGLSGLSRCDLAHAERSKLRKPPGWSHAPPQQRPPVSRALDNNIRCPAHLVGRLLLALHAAGVASILSAVASSAGVQRRLVHRGLVEKLGDPFRDRGEVVSDDALCSDVYVHGRRMIDGRLERPKDAADFLHLLDARPALQDRADDLDRDVASPVGEQAAVAVRGPALREGVGKRISVGGRSRR